ncbi:MAG: glucose-1-phosphate cytidylyltransferase [Bacteroidales bacterium]|nr:glucose-1-phosphate cytidylyltransferase [Bacteroidales bacterium]
MKAVLLAGGFGTRISEESQFKPKPMIEIGGMPILWHIMKLYSHYGIDDFIICCGYKQYVIKEYFANYFYHNCDMTVNLANNEVRIMDNHSENWRVTMVDTGLMTMTGGRVKRIQKYIGEEPFLLTYGDGVSDVNIQETIRTHKESGKILTMTAYQPGGRLGVLNVDEDGILTSFIEKPKESGTWINAGFFVCEPEIFDYLEGDAEMFEKEPMQKLVSQKQIHVYKHTGFWKPMDTLRDNLELNKLWDEGHAPWKVWE